MLPKDNLLHGMPVWLRQLLISRGVENDQFAAYLAPTLTALDDPCSMADMQKAVERLKQALQRQEPIVIYGDYDVDGVCSTAIMVEFLRGLGATVSYYIPDRRAEGYGLNAEAIAKLCTQAQLIVTVDCGATAHAEIALAQDRGVDVLVVDHHQMPSGVAPPAHATLNPHRSDCAYPFKDLCAAGVAFMLVVALRRALRDANFFALTCPEPDVRILLDMVAVATVADMVPMRGSNRILVAAGLRQLALAPRPGLAALCKVAKVQQSAVTATDLGFRLGPRINARGRMSQAGLAVDLMLTQDGQQAAAMAQVLDEANQARRQTERSTLEAALQQVEEQGLHQQAALVVSDPTWHPGVLGLVASRLAARFARPALVIGEGGKGSGRSVEGVNLHAALSAVAAHLLRFGGHPAAAGVTVSYSCVDSLRDALAAQVEAQLGTPPFVPVLKPDMEIEANMLNLTTVSAVQRLAPFGQGNPEPLFVSRSMTVGQRRLVGENHLKLRLGRDADAIGFGMGNLANSLPERVDAAFYLERNTYRGQESAQLRLADLRPASSHGEPQP